MTEETLKYTAVQPVAAVPLLRNCLWNELKFRKLYKNQKYWSLALVDTFTSDVPSEKMCGLWHVPSFQHFYLIYISYCQRSAILLTALISELQTCCSSKVHGSPLGLDCFCPAEYDTVLETAHADSDYDSLQQLPRKFCGNCTLSDNSCGQSMSYKFP